MKAIVYHKYGSPDYLQFAEVEKPTPQAGELLIKNVAAAANALDWHFLRGTPFFMRLIAGLFKPKRPILGTDFAGVVEAVGTGVTGFKVGDEVFGKLSLRQGFGGYAEYVCCPQDSLVLKPSNLTFAEAAAVPLAAITALQGLQKVTQVKPGDKVLINGASGGVGTFAIQIAKAFGADVTAVCSSSKVELARSLGVDDVIDYTQEDFAQSGRKYDFIVSVNGDRDLQDYEKSLVPKGTFVRVGGSMREMYQAIFLGPIRSMLSGKILKDFTARPTKKDLLTLKELIEAGKVKPVIDRRYRLDQVADAIRYLKDGHAKGKIVIDIATLR